MEPFLVHVIAFVLLSAMTITAVLVIPALLVRDALRQVVRVFRGHGSLCSDRAKTVQELGLTPPPFSETLGRVRDYKPVVLEALIHTGVVRVINDNKVCLDEDKLRQFEQKLEIGIVPGRETNQG